MPFSIPAAACRWKRGRAGPKPGRGRPAGRKKNKVAEAIKAQKQAQDRRNARDPKASFLGFRDAAAAPDDAGLPPAVRLRAPKVENLHPEGAAGAEDAGAAGGPPSGGADTAEAEAAAQNPFKRKPLPRMSGDGDRRAAGSEKPHALKVCGHGDYLPGICAPCLRCYSFHCRGWGGSVS